MTFSSTENWEHWRRPVGRYYNNFLTLTWWNDHEIIEAVVRRCSVKYMLLEISQNSLENTCARVWHRCFPVNFAKFLTAPFFTETTPVAVSEWTLLMKTDIQYTQGPITISSFQRFRGVFLSFFQKFLPADIFKQYRLSESNLIKNKRRTVKKHKEQWENQRACINCVTTEKVIFEEVL